MAERDAGEQRTMPWPLSYLAAALTPAAAAADPAPKTERFLDETSKLSLINGTVKHLTRRQLKHELSLKGLDTTGIDDILRARLRKYYQAVKLAAPGPALEFDVLCVIDFEATCVEETREYPHEIIEFPVVIVDCKTHQIIREYRSYCRPIVHPQLSEFCTTLTGITQRQVDNGLPFPEVVGQVEALFRELGLGTQHRFAVATDGPWDMRDFMSIQCAISGIERPAFSKHWIDIRALFARHYGVRLNVNGMLNAFGMEFEGSPHSGLDDSRNIARILIQMLRDKVPLAETRLEDIVHHRSQDWERTEAKMRLGSRLALAAAQRGQQQHQHQQHEEHHRQQEEQKERRRKKKEEKKAMMTEDPQPEHDGQETTDEQDPQPDRDGQGATEDQGQQHELEEQDGWERPKQKKKQHRPEHRGPEEQEK